MILRSNIRNGHKIIAIEAKLSDWKNGFYQALRYRYFANQSYLAIKNGYIKNIDKSTLTQHIHYVIIYVLLFYQKLQIYTPSNLILKTLFNLVI